MREGIVGHCTATATSGERPPPNSHCISMCAVAILLCAATVSTARGDRAGSSSPTHSSSTTTAPASSSSSSTVAQGTGASVHRSLLILFHKWRPKSPKEWVQTRLESRIKHFNPHSIYDWCLQARAMSHTSARTGRTGSLRLKGAV